MPFLPRVRPSPLLRLLALVGALAPTPAAAQNPLQHPTDAVEVRYAHDQPIVHYILQVDSTDLSGYGVEIRLAGLPDTFSLAMVKHPEYDDRYWRFIEGLRVETAAGPAVVTRADSGLWRVSAPGGRAIVRYRLHLPPPQSFRPAWRPFLARAGGLVGGPQSFLYVVGATLVPAHLTLELPEGWDAATGLEPTVDPETFFAPTIDILTDSPILIGKFRDWEFAVDGVPHRVVYWSLPSPAPFDSTAFTQGIEQVVRQAISLFGRAPYRDYTFLFQDDAYGALEHLNSVTLGAPSTALAKDPDALLEETAHEYFHSWNLMRIRPAEYGGVDYRGQPPAAELWFSEGFTMFYADLLLRRAQLRAEDSTRTRHLAHLMERYLGAEGYARYSAERVSRVANVDGPGNLGDYQLSTHLQGELIGAMLDLVIRDATHGRRTLDDLMRGMNERFSGVSGFTGADVERVAGEVCRCGVKGFFDGWVRGKGPVRFDRYLPLIGLTPKVTWAPARSDSGAILPDLRIWAWTEAGHASPALILQTPNSAWGKAGLHTGDRVVGWNGAPIRNMDDFRTAIHRVQLNDTIRITVRRDEKPVRIVVVATSYDTPTVTLELAPNATADQRARREEWLAGSAGDAGE